MRGGDSVKALYDFLSNHAERGSCTCGKCFDAPENPAQPTGHTADMCFFKVAAKNSPDIAKLRELIASNQKGDWATVDLFDGKEHNYMELGGWIGDQGAALTLMGLGAVLGLWRLWTPMTILGLTADDPLAKQMAGRGMIAIKVEAVHA